MVTESTGCNAFATENAFLSQQFVQNMQTYQKGVINKEIDRLRQQLVSNTAFLKETNCVSEDALDDLTVCQPANFGTSKHVCPEPSENAFKFVMTTADNALCYCKSNNNREYQLVPSKRTVRRSLR